MLSIMAIVLTLPTIVYAKQNPFEEKLPFKTAVIHYKLMGSQQGTEVLYVKRGYEARYTDTSMSMMGIKQVEKSIEITTPDYVYKVDLKEGKAVKHVNPQKIMKEEYERLSSHDKKIVRENVKKLGTTELGFFKGMGMGGMIKRLGEEKLFGKVCDVIEVMGVKTWAWKGTGIVLKTEGNVMGMKISQVATKIEENVPIPETKFRVPNGIKIVTDPKADARFREMAKRFIEWLKDPDALKKGMGGMMSPGMHRGGQGEGNTPKGLPLDLNAIKEMLKQQKGQ